MRIVLSLLAAGALAMGSPALADPASTQAPPAVVQDPPTDVSEAVVTPPAAEEDPTICRREVPTGSRIGVKVCMKKSQWVAKSTRRSGVGELQHVDGLDDKAAPLPPSNE